MIVQLYGLEVFGHHGVLDEEQRDGQLFWFDIQLEVGDRGVTDSIDDAIDYRLIADAVREVSARRFDLLEALASATADELYRRFAPERVSVRVRKKPSDMPVEFSAVTAVRP